MSSVIQPFRNIIHTTTTTIIDSGTTDNIAEVLTSLIDSVFNAVDDTLSMVQDLTADTDETAESRRKERVDITFENGGDPPAP